MTAPITRLVPADKKWAPNFMWRYQMSRRRNNDDRKLDEKILHVEEAILHELEEIEHELHPQPALTRSVANVFSDPVSKEDNLHSGSAS